ncbi:TonB-linked SusC/RagA family outer membrane protein [Aquimarina sp. MAR_2010_214]|uniref:SusC/RagA family TonB-linked outer membrane protein n=1 Tax=Aquimarina sp. MAR_2010_214 TaxID=1250026 RepID=UPI000C70D1F1|nr:TonB-dependent receptor [Aquimarina sp. MAR_2010_214]PKV52665.1 TonB-linked SusC/RagA family outer membrane protein [Aquimarina sp. MAR_2010_214]
MRTKFSGILTLLLAFVVQFTFAQEKMISGTVTDDKGLPLPGVNVVVKNTASGTQTDFDGNYTLQTNRGAVLSFSYVGFETKEVIVGDNTSISVQLTTSSAELEEVIVTAYGLGRKSTVTAAISTVAAQDIEDFVPTTSIDNILQGQAAGVSVTAANGRPGNTAFVQIRGVGSINASTTPLYVIDGVPIPINENEQFNPLNNLNPNDIESLSILKDAASASKYGSRGANGVVLITTKKGKAGEAKISFNSSYGFGKRTSDPFDLMNAEQKLEIERQFAALRNTDGSIGVPAAQSLPGATSTPEQLRALIALDTDWEEELLRTSVIQNNSLSISGGSEDLTYFLSLGYNVDTGIIDRIDGFERISARLNTTYQAKKWLSIGANVSAARSTTDLPRDRNNVQNPFRGMYDYNPYAPLYARDANGAIVTDADGRPVFNRGGGIFFPIAEALTTEPEDNRNLLFLGSVYADIAFSDKFSNRFAVGLTNNRFNRTNRSLPGGVLQGFIGVAGFEGTQTENINIDFEYNVSNLFTYTDTFNDSHNLNASILLEYNESIRNEKFVSSRGFPSPNIPFLDVAAEATAAGGNEARRILFSQAFFGDYNYEEKYIASVSVRRDGSSRFGPDNKFGTFYSGSLAWNIAQESFLQSSAFNNLKLRASYGTSGNQNIPDFEFINAADFSTYNRNTALRPLRVGNPEIQWESQAILDIGLEFGLLNNRINGVVDYFKKNSRDLLLNRPISQTVGDEDNGLFSNVGEIENSGVEISLNADIIKTQDLLISLGGNITFIDNKVKKLVDGQDIITGVFGNIILREGEETFSHYLVEYAGVNPNNGAPQYVDLNGNITETFSAGDLKIQKDKSPLPNMQGGFFASLKYKGFGLRGDFVFSAGNYILNRQRASGEFIGNIDSNLRTSAFNYWKQPGDTNVLPSPLFQNDADQFATTRFLEKGDYVRLRTLTVDYTVPRKFIDVLPIDKLRLYVTGQNILTFTDYEGDPEIGLGSAENGEPGDAGFVAGSFSQFSYPQIKSYLFGVEIGF